MNKISFREKKNISKYYKCDHPIQEFTQPFSLFWTKVERDGYPKKLDKNNSMEVPSFSIQREGFLFLFLFFFFLLFFYLSFSFGSLFSKLTVHFPPLSCPLFPSFPWLCIAILGEHGTWAVTGQLVMATAHCK